MYTYKTRCTPMQRRFVDSYIVHRDMVKAYVDSRDKKPKLSDKNLKIKAKQLLRTNTIQSMLKEVSTQALMRIETKAAQERDAEISKYAGIKERIIDELMKIAFANVGDVMTWGPDGVRVKDSSEIGDAGAAVGEVFESGGGENSSPATRVKMLDKQTALINLGKEFGMFQQKIEHKGQIAVAAKFIVEGK